MNLSQCEFFSPLQKPQLNEKLRCFDCRVQQQLQQVFRDFNATCIDLRIGDNCLKMTGYIAIYKISFSITIFFVTMFFITLGVTTSKGIRACIHNGFWLIKVSKKYLNSSQRARKFKKFQAKKLVKSNKLFVRKKN